MKFNDINSMIYFDDRVVIDGVDMKINTVLKNVKSVQYLKGRDFIIEEPSMKQVPLSKYQYVLDEYEKLKKLGVNLTPKYDTDPSTEINSIKDTASQIITSRYPIYKQMNILGEGGEAQIEMTTWIKKIRDISNKAELDGTALADINWEI